MKKTLTIALLAFVFAALTACGNQNEQVETGTRAGTDIEVDTAITQDPDTTTYHDMTL